MPMAAHHACFGCSPAGQMPAAFPSSLTRQRLTRFKILHFSESGWLCLQRHPQTIPVRKRDKQRGIIDVPVHFLPLPCFAALSFSVNLFFHFWSVDTTYTLQLLYVLLTHCNCSSLWATDTEGSLLKRKRIWRGRRELLNNRTKRS